MRWTPGGRSKDLEDLRGQTGGGGGGMMLGRGMGIGGAVIALILSLVFGVNIFDNGGGSPVPQQTAPGAAQQPVNSSPKEDERIQFVSFVLDDVQQTWAQLLPKVDGQQYHNAHLAVFRDAVNTGCGEAPAEVGPFYCPVDQKVYLDLSFFDELAQRFGAPGDFAQAYVIAHELGHHVQHLLGIDQRVRQMQESRPAAANQLSVALELQADCFAGVWGNSTSQRKLLEQGDIEEGLGAASAVGDDRIQAQTTGRVRPDTFTHGTSAQRSQWFRRGLESGDPNSCNTFGGSLGRG
ncbi:MAG TPA: neutral zinc metallopeptidase [Gemmatimonadaceae bacterium]|jgi:predicted metalloprotease|nr:neutral zinc metallopeptidase [Gemmatimonadaceae bacterium]